ncbi:PREDICTED: DNA topoisomerase 6 subunit A3-like [Prunus mume]|uniref:DNA topoisomerase 6 subunit A3-like n=1 Tax=Prunus mume TaxID=102107 RepID=A0ABM0P8B8_PRUMU|nr:PREDICTED: DNA topoisomerase 6 subunit A3-like [Prunus mume]
MPKRDKSVSFPCIKINKGVSINKKLRLAIESALQINHPRDESSQLEVQRKIDFELIKKNIEEHRCTSLSLRVVSDTTGTVIGPFTFVCGDTPHECSSSAEKIPSCEFMADTRFNNCKASFILLVEKNTVLHDLAQANFHENAKCIMVSGQGYGDGSTKVFLKKLHRELRIPILAIVDCNPYGLQILFDYKYGSANSAFDSVNLAIKDIRWLGVRPLDLEKYKIDVEDNKFTGRAVSMAKGFLEQDFVKMDDNWVCEIEKMLEIGNSVNIERLHTKGIDFLSMKFLAEKLESKDWI